MGRTSVSRQIDAGRLSHAVSRPGIDPRIWTSLAVALADSVMDNKNGVFVDVMLLPTQEQYTARVSADYVGNGFGLYFGTVHKDDELTVEAPSGDPLHGLVVSNRNWSSVALPPQDAIDNPADVCLTVEKDKNLRLRVSGQGQVYIVTDNADVNVNTGGGKVSVDTGGGDVDVSAGGGAITLDSGGGSVYLAENADSSLPMDGVVQGQGIDPFTGATYFVLNNTSSLVFAKKS